MKLIDRPAHGSVSPVPGQARIAAVPAGGGRATRTCAVSDRQAPSTARTPGVRGAGSPWGIRLVTAWVFAVGLIVVNLTVIVLHV